MIRRVFDILDVSRIVDAADDDLHTFIHRGDLGCRRGDRRRVGDDGTQILRGRRRRHGHSQRRCRDRRGEAIGDADLLGAAGQEGSLLVAAPCWLRSKTLRCAHPAEIAIHDRREIGLDRDKGSGSSGRTPSKFSFAPNHPSAKAREKSVRILRGQSRLGGLGWNAGRATGRWLAPAMPRRTSDRDGSRLDRPLAAGARGLMAADQDRVGHYEHRRRCSDQCRGQSRLHVHRIGDAGVAAAGREKVGSPLSSIAFRSCTSRRHMRQKSRR